MVLSSCPHDCGGKCVLKVHVKDGVIIGVESDAGEEPQLRACLRGRAQRQRVYAPDRLKFPMKRVGARGEGEFERISWNEALDTVAGELKRIKKTYGSSAIFLLYGAGNVDVLLHTCLCVSRLLSMFGGYTTRWGSASDEGALLASEATYGTTFTGHGRDDLINSRLIIMWGCNPAWTILRNNTRLYLAKAKEASVKIISVDPIYTDSAAAFASQWIPIRPGTSTAMLIAMAYVIIKEGLQDQKFLNSYTVGFNQFKDYVIGAEEGILKTPAWAEAITGVPAATIKNLAIEYATAKPSALIAGWAPGRTAYGEQFHRAAMTLAAITGNIGIHGGNPTGPEALAGGVRIVWGLLPVGDKPVALIHITKVWDAILRGKAGGYPADIKMLYVVTGNPVNQYLNTNKGINALKSKKLEFIAVHEQFMTATAKFADILLPVNTHFERNDIAVPWLGGDVGPYYIYMNKVINSLYESKSDFDICSELAVRLGIPNYSQRTEDEWLREFTKLDPIRRDIPEYDAFKREGVRKIRPQEPVVAFKEQIEDPKNHPFPTPSGKIEIYSKLLADMNNPKIPPIPKYFETWESRNDPLTKKYPLQLITVHFQRRAHSTFDNIPWLKEVQRQEVWINSIDAWGRDIRNGNMVRVFNDRGEMIIPAKVTERIMPGVVSIGQGAWYNPDERGVDRGGCPNILTKDEHSPGGAFCSNTCLVQVQRV